METDTRQKILDFIRKKGEVSAKDIISFSGYYPTGVFRHLKKLVEDGLISKKGKMPNILYYPISGNTSDLDKKVIVWAETSKADSPGNDIYCPSRDVFQARLEHLLIEMKETRTNQNLSFLINAVTGEIGNNSFDHNLGNWRDVAGVYFAVDLHNHQIILADRGQGVRATLSKVQPNIKNDQQALRVAFTKVISGRYPEQRGNGLKFVRHVVKDNKLQLKYYSGVGQCIIEKNKFEISKSQHDILGTVAIIKY